MTNSNLATSFQKAQGYSVFYIFSQVFIFYEKQIGCFFYTISAILHQKTTYFEVKNDKKRILPLVRYVSKT